MTRLNNILLSTLLILSIFTVCVISLTSLTRYQQARIEKNLSVIEQSVKSKEYQVKQLQLSVEQTRLSMEKVRLNAFLKAYSHGRYIVETEEIK